MKKRIKYIVIILLIIALIPIPHHIKDGGSVVYKALLYSVTKVHRISMSADNAYDVGWTIEILGKTVYDKTDIAYIKHED